MPEVAVSDVEIVTVVDEATPVVTAQVAAPSPVITIVQGGPPGAPGPPGANGTDVVEVPYNAWPPIDPQPDTLYLRLSP